MSTVRTENQIRRAELADLRQVAAVLAEAFADDPVVSWVIPDPAQRRAVLPASFALITEGFMKHRETYLTGDAAGVALWTPPGAAPVGPDDEEAFGRRFTEILGAEADRGLRLLELMEQHHPAEPSFYLGFAGVRPKAQGRGLGTALLTSVLPRADAAGAPSYLEATSERNRRLYKRHGYETIGEIPLPDGPSLWPMWREPSA